MWWWFLGLQIPLFFFLVGGESLVVVRMGREKGLRDRDVSDRCAFPLVIVGWGGFDRLV